MTLNTYQDLIDAMSEAARVQEQAYNEIQRLRADLEGMANKYRILVDEAARLQRERDRFQADHLAQAQRAAELQEEVDRLEHELDKTRRIMARRGETIRRMEEGDL
jgi:predicted nuclease with TOPRIM domain